MFLTRILNHDEAEIGDERWFVMFLFMQHARLQLGSESKRDTSYIIYYNHMNEHIFVFTSGIRQVHHGRHFHPPLLP
ncbi:hypothetical protein L6452_35392 [Arctium lappa]|uniref:Uncharacterized protein n=1 Tax=Arctium lappa TaxID=4217 RepID=A0ACB8Y7F6_ARCLA|nr:hypothetical protein L6452_35392 [Arctium lappa]